MPLQYLAYTCALLPAITVHITLFTAFYYGNLHACVPYLNDCHSISATGRQYPEFFVFKGMMIPAATFMSLYWLCLTQWMKTELKQSDGRLVVLVLGQIAAVALIVYTVTLGAVGEPYALSRRIGVVLFFAFSAFAHLLLVNILQKNGQSSPQLECHRIRLLRVCLVLVFLGLLSALLGFLWLDYHHWENGLEWCFGALLVLQFIVVGRMWRATDARVELN